MTDNIAKYVIIALAGMFAAAVFGWFTGGRELKRRAEVRRHPLKFSYFIQPRGASLGLISDDKECIELIKLYYDSLSTGKNVKIPTCVQYGINFEDSVFVEYLDADSIYAWVSVLHYKSSNGIVREFSGYVFV